MQLETDNLSRIDNYNSRPHFILRTFGVVFQGLQPFSAGCNMSINTKPRAGKMNCKTTQIDRMMRTTWCEIMRDSSIRLVDVVGRAGIRRKSGATNFFPNKRAEHSGLKTATSNQHLSSVYLSPVRRPTSFHTAFLSGPRKRFRTCFIYFICVWRQGEQDGCFSETMKLDCENFSDQPIIFFCFCWFRLVQCVQRYLSCLKLPNVASCGWEWSG